MSDRRLILGDTPPYNVVGIPHSEAVAGDILAFDGVKKRLFRFVDEGATDSIQNYTPIGVVVIPTNHNVYGDGSCGVMSLKFMSANYPDTGHTASSLAGERWGGYGIDISQLANLNYVVAGNTENGAPTGLVNNAYIPSNLNTPSSTYNHAPCMHDENAYYHYELAVFTQAPSPYLTDGSRNPGYHQTSSPSSISNSLSDFDGFGNSQILWSLSTSQSDWKTADTIIEETGAGYYPTACCCWRYHTDGTNQGDWYLPAMGELGYLYARLRNIYRTTENIRSIFGSSYMVWILSDDHWSSTEIDNNNVFALDLSSGEVYSTNKDDYCYTRAFLKLSHLDL